MARKSGTILLTAPSKFIQGREVSLHVSDSTSLQRCMSEGYRLLWKPKVLQQRILQRLSESSERADHTCARHTNMRGHPYFS